MLCALHMRDHPYHGMPILAGMWGCRGGVFLDIEALINEFCPTTIFNQDQLFLEQVIYPRLLKAGCCVHALSAGYRRLRIYRVLLRA